MKSVAEELSMAHQNCGRPIGSKDNVLWKRKMIKQGYAINNTKNLKE